MYRYKTHRGMNEEAHHHGRTSYFHSHDIMYRTWHAFGMCVALYPLRRLGILFFLCILIPSFSITSAQSASENDARFVRIGTGPAGGSYFPVGGLIANAISNPPGSQPCDKGGSCGAPGVIAVAQSTNGSVENIRRLTAGEVDLAFVQAGIAFRAMNMGDLYEGQKPLKKLRAVARLYPELVHLVARQEKAITSVKDLRSKRVAMGDPGSGTLFETESILEAYGVGLQDVEPSYGRPSEESERLRQDQIDALFFISGAPNQLINRLLHDNKTALVPISEGGAERIVARSPFFSPGVLSKTVYPDMTEDVWTISVDTLLVATTDTPEPLIEAITRAVWHPTNLRLYRKGNPQAAALSWEKAIKGIGIPLHDGAQKVYFNFNQSG